VGQWGRCLRNDTNIIIFTGTSNIYSRYVGEVRGLPRSFDPNTTNLRWQPGAWTSEALSKKQALIRRRNRNNSKEKSQAVPNFIVPSDRVLNNDFLDYHDIFENLLSDLLWKDVKFEFRELHSSSLKQLWSVNQFWNCMIRSWVRRYIRIIEIIYGLFEIIYTGVRRLEII